MCWLPSCSAGWEGGYPVLLHLSNGRNGSPGWSCSHWESKWRFQNNNMLAKRIVPCLDIKDGRTVKGTNFVNLRDAGDPVELAANYAQQGADELVFLDITATVEKRKTLSELVNRIAHKINIPFTVGGGISTIEDVRVLFSMRGFSN